VELSIDNFWLSDEKGDDGKPVDIGGNFGFDEKL
jgi:hypothetical protein